MTAAPSNLQHSSPLDTLLRRTSNRKARHLNSNLPSASSSLVQLTSLVTSLQTEHQSTPSSPLLHSRFRASTATDSSDDRGSSFDPGRSYLQENTTENVYHDDDSVYSRHHAIHGVDNALQRPSDTAQDSRGTTNPPTSFHPSDLPSFIISSPDADHIIPYALHQGKAPITFRATSEYSRPVLPIPSASISEQHKRQVRERNIRRSPSFQPSSHDLMSLQSMSESNHPSDEPESPIPPPTPKIAVGDKLIKAASTISSLSSPHSPPLHSQSPDIHSSHDSTPPFRISPSPNTVRQPRQPPSLTTSPSSPYSTYSFYQLDSPIDSPTTPVSNVQPIDSHTPSPSASRTRSTAAKPQTPYDYLQMGIQYHEANKLNDSAVYFEKSAKEQGVCGVGMLMWGLALRHGWGCEKNEKVAFRWLQKAAESAVDDLEQTRGGLETTFVQTELILAIYEVGQCFFQGWGVTKDQKMGLSYFRVAARLGDMDAQNDLAFCLANGKGCKNDRKEAARWYRAAVSQGASDVGLAWIYKEKYQ